MKLRVILAIVGLVILLVPALYLGPYYYRAQHFEAVPESGFHASFYFYLAPSARRAAQDGKKITLLVQPNNSGTNSDDPEVHRRDAWWTGFGRHGLADDLGVALLVPAFVRPAGDWEIYTHALDRDVMLTDRTDLARLDLQLLAMIERVGIELSRLGIEVDERFLIQGYSASGMFANRFTALHPERVLAVAAGSPGGWPIAPASSFNGTELPYPGGIADIETITGQIFDSTAYRAVPQLIVMGSLDENDSLDYGDGWAPDAAERIKILFGETPLERWEDSAALYKAAGANATFLLIEGVGHDRRSLQKYSTEFFRDVLSHR